MGIGLKLFSQDGNVTLDSSTQFTNVLGVLVTPSHVGGVGSFPETDGRVYCRNLSRGNFWYNTYFVGSEGGNVPPRVYREGEWLVWSYRRADCPSWLSGNVDAGNHKIVYGVY